MKKIKKKGKPDPIWELVDNFYTLGMQLREPFESQWLLNLQFLKGNQYVYFNRSAFRIEDPKALTGETRKCDNQLAPRVRRQIADAIKIIPEMSVVPATNDSDDIEAAKIGTKVMKSFWHSNRMHKKLRELALWRFTTGNCFLDCRWDSRLGRVEKGKDGELYYEGDVDCGVWSPLEILVPYDPNDLGSNLALNSFPWMMKVKRRDLGYLVANYANGKEVEAEVEGRASGTGKIFFGQSKELNLKIEGAYLKELYLQPCSQYPKGLFVSAANGVILHKADYPYTTYNIEHFIDQEIPGSFWGKATMQDAIPLQVTWNETLSDFVEFNKTMARGKYLKPRGSKLSPITTEIGQVLEYEAVLGAKPEMLTFKGTPSSYMDILSLTRASLDDLFSQHEITRGTNKSDIRSGEMVSLLREQDAHGGIPTSASFEERFENLMKLVLKRIKDNYTSTRMLTLVGKQKQFEVFSFQGSDLRGCLDVFVKKQSSIADSRIARENAIMNRFQAGLYGDPNNPEVKKQVMIMLDEAVVEDIYSGSSIEETLINWENRVLMQKELEVNPYDDSFVHLNKHSLYLKTLEIQQMKLDNIEQYREIQIRFMQHMQAHQEFADEQIERRITNERAVNGRE